MVKKLEKVNVVGIAGLFLALEGVMSMMGSQDQQPISNFGRLIRITIGTGMVLFVL